jgi:hypothetical protein
VRLATAPAAADRDRRNLHSSAGSIGRSFTRFAEVEHRRRLRDRCGRWRFSGVEPVGRSPTSSLVTVITRLAPAADSSTTVSTLSDVRVPAANDAGSDDRMSASSPRMESVDRRAAAVSTLVVFGCFGTRSR